MRLAMIIVVFLAGPALKQAAAQPPELRVAAAPLPADTRGALAPELVRPPLGHPTEHGFLPPAGHPSAPGMTLAELESIAERCNPTLAQAAARVQAARGEQLQVGLYPNPVVGYLGSEIGNEGRAGQQGGFIGQEIVTAGKLQLNRAVAGQEVRQAEFVWAAQRFRVLTDVRRGFYEVLVAQRTVELAQQLVGIGERGVETAEQLMKAKEVARTDVLQARIEADSAQILLQKAQNRYTGAWRTLAAVVGDPAMQPTPLAGNLQDDIVPFTWEDTLNRLLIESPQLAGAQAGVARARAALSREAAGRVPNVDLQAGVQYDNATQDTYTTVQVGVPIPVHNRNQGNIRKAQAELTAAQHEVRRVQLALRQQLAAVFEQYATAHQQVEKYNRDIMPNAEESLKLVSSGYRQGEFSYLMLLTAQRTYFQTSLAYLDALRDLRAAVAAIEGNLLGGSLQALDRGV
ncbi:MAG: TolC family protein [Rhodopirellula sp.]|nr:TolC family protein [Rhodopirellula sp.]